MGFCGLYVSGSARDVCIPVGSKIIWEKEMPYKVGVR